MSWLCMLPLALQGLLTAADELGYHRRRGLPRWERIGHPLDSLSVLACLGLPWLAALGAGSLRLYAGLALFSCALVTKDEWVHARCCSAGEHWLHAALFLVHPLALGAVLVLWSARDDHPLARALGGALELPAPDPAQAGALLAAQGVLVAGFALYQALYWGARGDR